MTRSEHEAQKALVLASLGASRPKVYRERDDVTCGACLATIPNVVGGQLYNRWHDPSCQFHAS